jgi:hypothetical protein
MKRCLKFVLAVLVVGISMLAASASYAQTFPFIGAGSSAAFNVMALGGEAGTTPICTNASGVGATFNWTVKKGTIQGSDSRGAIDPTNGNVWVEWATGTTNPNDPPTAICLYLNIDSIAGNRLFFGTASSGLPSGFVNITVACSTLATTAGAGLVPLLPADQPGLPTTVCGDLQGLPFNAAPSDIRAEDAKFGVQRALTAWSSTAAGLGYGPGPIGAEIQSGVDTSTAQVQAVDFNIAGNDPINTSTPIAHSTAGADAKAYVSLNVGGQVVLVLVNTSDTSTSGFGSAALTSVDRRVLSRVFSGQITRTRDLIPATGLSSKGITVLQREPLSGTMNTFEFQTARNLEANTSQEDVGGGTGNAPVALNPGGSVPTGWTGTLNPLAIKYTKSSALKVRAIGTGEMVNAISGLSCGTPCQDKNGDTLSNQIGYAFFSFGNVKPAIGLAKYLLVDGVDPLFAVPSNNPGGVGALPSCTAPCSGAVALTNVENGTYPLWNILRVITTGTLGANTNGVCNAGATVCQLVAAASAQVASIPDFATLASMQVFRSHSTIQLNGVAFAGHNGNSKRSPESGSDVEGAILTTQSDLDAITDTNGEEVTLRQ